MQTIVINIPVRDISLNIEILKVLGFRLIDNDKNLMSNGQVILRLSHRAFFEKGFFICTDDFENQIARIEKAGLHLNCKYYTKKEFVEGCLLDPNKVFFGVKKMDKQYKLDGPVDKTIGTFAGLGIETLDFERTSDFWEKIGLVFDKNNSKIGHFHKLHMNGFSIVLYRKGYIDHLFHNPAIMFKDSRMDTIIDKLKDKGILFRYETEINADHTGAIIELDSGIHIFLHKEKK
ncbi:MAG: hypothetical protein N4A72_02870 [Bacteroidales bacterium]|jgi:predicted lactoylglutathione lyase|nr:hypothetical protein [Bacteroidales bacterium]